MDAKKIEDLRRQVRVTKEDASRCRMEIDSMVRAATTDRAWAKEELDKKEVHIRWLQAENDHLRRANRKVEMERDEMKRAYTDLAKQSAHCRRCLQHLNPDDRCLPIIPIETETRQRMETPLAKDSRDRYRDSVLIHGDLSSPTGAVIRPAAIQGPNVLAASVPTDSVSSDSDGPSIFTGTSPILTSRDTLPSSTSSSRCPSPVRTSRNASSTPSGLLDNSRHSRRAGSLALRRGQAASSKQDPHHENLHGDAEEALGELSQGNLLAETSSRRHRIDHGRRSSSRASSDISMLSAPEPWEENEIAAEAGSEEQASADSLDSSSAETDEDSDEDSDMDPAPSVDASEEARKDADYDDAGRQGSTSHNDEAFFEQVPPTVHQRKGPAGRRVDSPKFSNGARPAARDAGSPKARSTSPNDVSSASRSLKPRASHNPIIFGSQSSAILDSSTQIQLIRADLAVSAPATAGQRCERPAYPGDEETDADLKTSIRESYTKFALSGQRLRFCYEPQTLDPTAINLNTNWKRRSKLNETVVKKLIQMGCEISAFLPESDSEKATKKETELIRRLCKCNRTQIASGSLREVVGALRRERDVTKDDLNLIEFEIYSTLIVMKCRSESEFEETVTEFSDYQCNLLGMYSSLHMFLAHLNQAWHGFHLLVLIYLLRVGAGRLVKYLMPTTRPAAIELLLQRFEKPELMTKHLKRLHHLVSLCGPLCATLIQQVTPLRRLQDRMASVLEPSIVRAALGYSNRYQSDAELDSLRPLYSTPKATPNYPRTLTSSSQRHDVYNPWGNWGDQGTTRSALEARSQSMETPYPSTVAERTGLGNSGCIDPNGEEEEDGNGPVRKRRCGIDRVNSYVTGCAIGVTSTPFSEGFQERNIFPLSVESIGQTRQGSRAETQGDSGYSASTDEGTEVMDDLCTNQHLITDSESPWSQMSPVPIDGYMQMEAQPQAPINGNYSAEATRRSPNLNLYDRCLSNVPQQAPSTDREESMDCLSHGNSSVACLPQELMYSLKDGTVDPRALELRF